jgi:hypothetical protein
VLASSKCAECKKFICPESEDLYDGKNYLCIKCSENYPQKELEPKKSRNENYLLGLFAIIFFLLVIILFYLS